VQLPTALGFGHVDLAAHHHDHARGPSSAADPVCRRDDGVRPADHGRSHHRHHRPATRRQHHCGGLGPHRQPACSRRCHPGHRQAGRSSRQASSTAVRAGARTHRVADCRRNRLACSAPRRSSATGSFLRPLPHLARPTARRDAENQARRLDGSGIGNPQRGRWLGLDPDRRAHQRRRGLPPRVLADRRHPRSGDPVVLGGGARAPARRRGPRRLVGCVSPRDRAGAALPRPHSGPHMGLGVRAHPRMRGGRIFRPDGVVGLPEPNRRPARGPPHAHPRPASRDQHRDALRRHRHVPQLSRLLLLRPDAK
jgi:hypothetical protein